MCSLYLLFRLGYRETSTIHGTVDYGLVSQKRERELARAKYERQQARRAEKQAKQQSLKIVGLSVAVLVVVSGYFAIQNRASSPVAAPSASTSANTQSVVSGCTEAPALRPNNISYQSVPKAQPAAEINLKTNCGDVTIAPLASTPKTAGIMTYLAQNKYFDLTACHRLTTQGIFVLQCGDPTASGSGGPGFKFADENLPKATASGTYVYKRGDVAMANSGANTNGSQFFLVYKDSTLAPSYTLWGKITSGLDRLDAIAGAGVEGGASDGKPLQPVVIEKATTK